MRNVLFTPARPARSVESIPAGRGFVIALRAWAAATDRMAVLSAATCILAAILGGRTLLRASEALLLRPGSTFSAVSLAMALLVAVGWVGRRRRRVSLRLLRRLLFPRRHLRNASTCADLGFCALNTLATGMLIGWALLSFPKVESGTSSLLAGWFGPPPSPVLPPLASQLVQTLVLFLAYEFAYWLDHWLSHEVPVFWAFHRVHHTAEVLTPLTVFRVHPVESLKFANIGVLVMAPAAALAGTMLGRTGQGVMLDGTNVLLVAFVCLTGHLQHSHVWLPFTERWGRILASPAHHQLHHSTDPAHFGCNLGSALCVFDWLFGTLMVPGPRRPKGLRFGVAPGIARPHGVTGCLLTPFVDAAQRPWRIGVHRRPNGFHVEEIPCPDDALANPPSHAAPLPAHWQGSPPPSQ